MAQNRFQETPCKVVINNNFDTHGTVTRATINHLTPQQLEDIFKPDGLFADMDAWFKTSFEMQACGIKVNCLYNWLMSSMRNMKPLVNVTKLDRGPSLLQPFVLARQDSVINNDFWAITCGCPGSGYTPSTSVVACSAPSTMTGPLTADDKTAANSEDSGYRVIRVVTRYGFDLDKEFFNNRDRIIIFGRSGGQMTQGQWKVLASEASADKTFVDVAISSQNSGSATPYDAAPVGGVVVSTGAYAHDFESYCANRPTQDPRKRVPFWVETVRRIRRVDSEYKRVFARLMESNQYFREFGDLPLAERNRQDEERFQKDFINAFFWGKAVGSNQTLALWQNLRRILTVSGGTIDPGTGGRLVAYEAYEVGVIEQLRACDRVRDLQNNPLNLYEWFDECYQIYRARKSQGKIANEQDWWMDQRLAANIVTAFVAYMKQEYGDIVRLTIETETNETLGFNYTSIQPKFPSGVKINLVTDEYFDDWVNAFDRESIASSGRMMLCLEIGAPGPRGGTVYPGMIASNRKMRTLGELEQLARLDPTFTCTMENITEEIALTSESRTGVVECPANNLAILAVADAVPVTTGKSANPSYSNLY